MVQSSVCVFCVCVCVRYIRKGESAPWGLKNLKKKYPKNVELRISHGPLSDQPDRENENSLKSNPRWPRRSLSDFGDCPKKQRINAFSISTFMIYSSSILRLILMFGVVVKRIKKCIIYSANLFTLLKINKDHIVKMILLLLLIRL